MSVDKIRHQLTTALTEYDRKQSARRGYNPNALGLYFQALDEAMDEYQHGASLQSALKYSFNDRVLDVCLRAVVST